MKEDQKTKNEDKKLKPVTFIKGDYREHYDNNEIKQKLLLKAMTVSNNPKEWRDMIGVHSVAEVYRTLDKLALRKEYHNALVRMGIDFDYLVSGIKNIGETAKNEGVKLKAFETLLKSVGMDKYEDTKESVKDWEDIIKEVEDQKELSQQQEQKQLEEIINDEYEVNIPKTPLAAKRKIEAEEEIGKEKVLMQNFFDTLSKQPKKVAYGEIQVKKALETGAVEYLLLSEIVPDQKIEELEIIGEQFGTKTEIISIETREGTQLKEMGGYAAILRYELH